MNKDILMEIAKFIEMVQDLFNLSLVCKGFYYDIMLDEALIILNEFFKRTELKSLDLPLNFKNLKNVRIKLVNKPLNSLQVLTSFTKLETLYLNGKNTKEINLESSVFSNLKELECDFYKLKPEDYNYFTQLNYLKMNFQSLSSTRNYKSLQNLKSLTLESCQILTFDLFQHLNNLEYLYLRNIFFSKNFNEENIKTNKFDLNSLKFLYLDNFNNYFIQHFINYTPNLICLKLLKCGNQLIDISHLRKLETLQFESIHFKDEDLQHFIYLKNLNISYNLTLKGDFLSFFPNLESLTLKSVNSYISSISCAKNLRNLTELSLQNCLSSNINLALKYSTKLKKLTLKSTDSVKDEYLKRMTDLKYLIVEDCKEFTGNCLLNLCNLEHLQLTNTVKVEDSFFKNLKHLRYLYIRNCSKLSGDCLNYLNELKVLHCGGYGLFQFYEIKGVCDITNLKLFLTRKLLETTNESNLNNLEIFVREFYKKNDLKLEV
ncbi:hypothetical protein ABK040_013930 [Willaertia magna]